MANWAIVLAGGSGSRFGGVVPKQFVALADGRPVVCHTLEKFTKCCSIHRVVLAICPEWKNWFKTECLPHIPSPDKILLCDGGVTRQQSVYNALVFLRCMVRGDDIILVHDGVRPFVSERIIRDCIRAVQEHGACDVVLGNPDTIVRVDGAMVSEILDRDVIYRGQTPQGFLYSLLLSAHEAALHDGITNASDDVRLVMRMGHRVKAVAGEERNFKITFEQDIPRANVYLKSEESFVLMPEPVRELVGTKFVIQEPLSIVAKRYTISSLAADEVVVEPTFLSICAADLRYYNGRRPRDVLERKLPLVPIHEAVGRVIRVGDSPGLLELVGRKVLLVPLVPCEELRKTARCPLWRDSGRLLCHSCFRSTFLSSDEDGFLCTAVRVPASQAIVMPENIPDSVAVLTELLSIPYAALKHVPKLRDSSVLVLGAGSLAFMTALALKYLFQVSFSDITVSEFAARDYRMERFPEGITKTTIESIVSGNAGLFGVVVDCVGGSRVRDTLGIAMECLRPGGTLVELGVTDDAVPINERKVLEKGLHLIGSSRSTKEDMEICLSSISSSEQLKSLLPKAVHLSLDVATAQDVNRAFAIASEHHVKGKILLRMMQHRNSR